jgi:hypothetical protein
MISDQPSIERSYSNGVESKNTKNKNLLSKMREGEREREKEKEEYNGLTDWIFDTSSSS